MTVICLYYQNTSKSIVIYHLFFLMGLKSVMEMKGSRINPPLSLSTPCTCVWCFLVLIRLKMNLTSELTNKCHLHQSTLITGHKLYFFFFSFFACFLLLHNSIGNKLMQLFLAYQQVCYHNPPTTTNTLLQYILSSKELSKTFYFTNPYFTWSWVFFWGWGRGD